MFKRKKARLVLVPDKRSWKERHRIDPRKRDRRGYKRPDAGKRPETHRGATSRGRYRKSGGNKQRTWRAKNSQRMKREGAFVVKEEQEEEPAIRAAPCLSIVRGASPTVNQEQFKEEEGTRGYKRPDPGKRPKTHSGATGGQWGRSRKSDGNKQRAGIATNNQRMKREGALIVKEEQEEEPEMDSQHDFQECRTSPTKPRWLDEQTEIPKEEPEMDSQHDFQECRTSPTKPRWFDEQTVIPEEKYHSYYDFTAVLDTFEYGIFLPHRAPNCGMTTTFGDLCDVLCEPLKRAHYVRANVTEGRVTHGWPTAHSFFLSADRGKISCAWARRDSM